MSDERVAALLRSAHPLVVIEAPAGCGKTYQGAQYAHDIADSLGEGRLLILTHTHAACDVFSNKTVGVGRHVEVKTIDALIGQIVKAYRRTLGLPDDPSLWALQNDGFDILADKAAVLLNHQPSIASSLARRYPIIICDEHQDCTLSQHEVVLALHNAGSRLRIFGDPLQRIYGARTDAAIAHDWDRWDRLKASGESDLLSVPHRWNRDGDAQLGAWVQRARLCLQQNRPIDLNDRLPASVRIISAYNQAQTRSGYQVSRDHRRPIDEVRNRHDQLMIMASNNDLTVSLRAFWGRSIPIWEGHTRKYLPGFIQSLSDHEGNPESIAVAIINFMGNVSIGCTQNSHGNRLCREIRTGCVKPTRGMPGQLQVMAKVLIANPNHKGAAECLEYLKNLIKRRETGFAGIKIDQWSEFFDAIRLGAFEDAASGYAELSQKRTLLKPKPAEKTISTVHKSKGMECDNAMIVMGKGGDFSRTHYSRCKLYVALSRAQKSLTIVLPTREPCRLFTT